MRLVRSNRLVGVVLFFGLAVFSLLPIIGQDKKPEPKKEPPRLAMTFPVGVVPGAPFRFTLRGQKLDTVTSIRFHEPKTFGKLLTKAIKVEVPKMLEAARVGDMQMDAEIFVPAGVFVRTVPFSVVSADGESNPLSLLVVNDLPIIEEKEPNNGFREAQPLQFPVVVRGSIQNSQDVDVFKFDAKAGQQVHFEVFAARGGSNLDSMLTLFDAAGQVVAANDDADDSADSRLHVTLPHAGTYYLSLSDAHDQGGSVNVYCLIATAASAAK